MSCKRRTAQYYKISHDTGDDSDYGPGLVRVLHEWIIEELLQVREQVNAESHCSCSCWVSSRPTIARLPLESCRTSIRMPYKALRLSFVRTSVGFPVATFPFAI